MANDVEAEPTQLPPDEAFAVLGNETRLNILRVLGDADGPLSFTALRDRVGIDQGRQFNYHLEKLLGHFVGKVDDGYALRPAGGRVLEAVLSGAVTESPVMERTEIDWQCWYCGASTIEVSYLEDQVGFHCPNCGGNYGSSFESKMPTGPPAQDRLGYLPFPPAGVHGREPRDVLEAALRWFLFEIESAAAGLCPRCSAPIEVQADVCEDHAPDGNTCDHCGRRYAVVRRTACTNCIHRMEFVYGLHLFTVPEMRGFLVEHGFDPVAPSFERLFGALGAYGETVHSREPLEATFNWELDGDRIEFEVADGEVVAATRPD